MYKAGDVVEIPNYDGQLGEVTIILAFEHKGKNYFVIDDHGGNPPCPFVHGGNPPCPFVVDEKYLAPVPFKPGEQVYYFDGNANVFVTVTEVFREGCFVTRTGHPATDWKSYAELKKVEPREASIESPNSNVVSGT